MKTLSKYSFSVKVVFSGETISGSVDKLLNRVIYQLRMSILSGSSVLAKTDFYLTFQCYWKLLGFIPLKITTHTVYITMALSV